MIDEKGQEIPSKRIVDSARLELNKIVLEEHIIGHDKRILKFDGKGFYLKEKGMGDLISINYILGEFDFSVRQNFKAMNLLRYIDETKKTDITDVASVDMKIGQKSGKLMFYPPKDDALVKSHNSMECRVPTC